MVLYSLLKSDANAVLRLMSSVIAIAHVHVLSVSIKSLSVSIMLLEFSRGNLKFHSITLPVSGFLGPSTVSASTSPIFFAILKFFINIFSVWVTTIPTQRKKYPPTSPVNRTPDIKLRLDAGMNNDPSSAAQERSCLSFNMYFVLSRCTS